MARALLFFLAFLGYPYFLISQVFENPCSVQADVGVSICFDPPGCVIYGANIENGTGPYSYLWQDGSTDAGISYWGSTNPGTCQSVTITDNNGCIAISGDVHPYSAPPYNISLEPDYFVADGSPLDFDVAENDQTGVGDFELVQPPIHGSVDFNSDGTGIYTPDPTYCGPDFMRYLFRYGTCTYSQIIDVQINNGPCATIIVEKADCNSGCNGAAKLYHSNLLVEPLNYEWSNGETGHTATNLCAGQVEVTVTDTDGMVEVYQADLVEEHLSVDVIGVTQGCRYDYINLGSSISVSTSAGYVSTWTGPTVPYGVSYDSSIIVRPGQPDEINEFMLSVHTDNGCIDTARHIVQALPNPNASTISTASIYCPIDTLELSTTVTGGTPPYEYNWTGPLGVQASTPNFVWPDADNTLNGFYKVIVTDANGCTTRRTKNIYLPDSLRIDVVPHGPDGPVCLGGDGIFRYGMTNTWVWDHWVEWIGPNGFYSTDKDLQLQNMQPDMAGTYQLTTFFPGGCSDTSYVEVEVSTEAAEIVDVNIVPPTDCSHPHDGEVTVTMSVPPPYFLTGNVGTYDEYYTNPFTIDGERYGENQRLEVFALNTCVAGQFIDIPIPDAPTVTTTDETCLLPGTGLVTSPNALQTVTWRRQGNASNDYESGEYVDSLVGGTYDLYIKDAETDCIFREIITIAPYLSFDVETVETPSCHDSTGVLQAFDMGNASPPIDYFWSNGATGETNEELPYDWYSVTMTDGDGCQRHQNVFLEPETACFSIITGNVYVNTDCICVADTNDYPFANVRVCAEYGNFKDCTYTDNTGAYQLTTNNAGDYEISVYTNNDYLSPACTTQAVQVFNDNINVNDVDIFMCGDEVTDYSLSLNCSVARPGFSTTFRFKVKNEGTIPNDTAVVTVQLPAAVEITQIMPTPLSFDPLTNEISWMTQNIPINSYEQFMVKATVNAALGDTLLASGIVATYLPDAELSNNSDFCENMVVGSYDPNDKLVNALSLDSYGGIFPNDSLLTYTIRFQNTGTDTAFTVVVRDTLDGDVFDLNSVRPLHATHAYDLDVEGEDILVFTFENINLPDSNRTVLGSQGYVMFEIKLKPDLPIGTVIENSAAIYFDFNEPVITEDATIEIILPGCDLPAEPMLSEIGDIDLCEGESLSLTANVCDSCQVIWSTGDTTVTIEVQAEGIYSAKAINGCGLSPSSEMAIVLFFEIPAQPDIEAITATDLCEGDSVMLFTIKICEGCMATWSDGQVGDTIWVTEADSYSVIATNPNNPAGCAQSIPSDVLVVNQFAAPAAPEILVLGDVTLCEGESVVFTTDNVCDDCTVHWSNGLTGDSIIISEAGDYSAYVVNSSLPNQCAQSVSSQIITVTFAEQPPVPIMQIQGEIQICTGEEVVLFVENDCNGCTLIWSTGEQGDTITVSETGLYFAYFSNAALPASCANSDISEHVIITVFEVPEAPVISAPADTEICKGEQVILSVPDVCEGCTVIWTNELTGEMITVEETGTYAAFIYDPSLPQNCSQSLSSDSVSITVIEFLPEISEPSLCELLASNGSDYQWYFNGEIIEGANGQTLMAEVDGLYSVSMLNPDGCYGLSDSYFVTECSTPTVDEIKELELTAFPNPARQRVYFELKNEISGWHSLKLLDINGREVSPVLNENLNAGTHLLSANIDDLPSGIYFYQLTSEQGVLIGKFVVEK